MISNPKYYISPTLHSNENIVQNCQAVNNQNYISADGNSKQQCYHKITVLPEPAQQSCRGLSQALKLGTCVNFAPIRRSASLTKMPVHYLDICMLCNKQYFLTSTNNKCIRMTMNSNTDASQLNNNWNPITKSLVNQKNFNLLKNNINCNSKYYLQNWKKKLQIKRRLSYDLIDFRTDLVKKKKLGIHHSTLFSEQFQVLDTILKQFDLDQRFSESKINELKAFSVELASLLYRGFSSTVWLCNPKSAVNSNFESVSTNSDNQSKINLSNKNHQVDSVYDQGNSTYNTDSIGDMYKTSSVYPDLEISFHGEKSASLAKSQTYPVVNCEAIRALCDNLKLKESTTSVSHSLNTCVSIEHTTLRLMNSEETPIVMKVVHKTKCCATELEQLSFESKFLSSISHPHIIKLLTAVDSETEQCMFFEHATIGDLESTTCCQQVPESICRWIAFQLLLALNYIHTIHRVVHCDLKPHNVLLFNDPDIYLKYCVPTKNQFSLYDLSKCVDWRTVRVKLGDFGLARKKLENSNLITFQCLKGTHGYLAPELLKRKDYSEMIDMWALGILLYARLGGYEPFYPSAACLTEPLDFDPRYWSNISMEAKDFLQNLLQKCPEKRLTTQKALKHPWLYNWYIQ